MIELMNEEALELQPIEVTRTVTIGIEEYKGYIIAEAVHKLELAAQKEQSSNYWQKCYEATEALKKAMEKNAEMEKEIRTLKAVISNRKDEDE